MAESTHARPKTEESVTALDQRVYHFTQEQVDGLADMIVDRLKATIEQRQRPSARPSDETIISNRTTVQREALTVTVEDADGDALLPDILRAAKDAVAALGFTDDHVADVWLEVHRDWMTDGRGDLEDRITKAEHTIRMLGMSLGLAHHIVDQERGRAQREQAEDDA